MASMRLTPSSRSRRLGRALVAAAALSFVAAGDASAQFAYGYMRVYPGPAYDDVPPLPPRAVVYRLQDRGFTEIGRPRFDGRSYVVDATNPAGARIRLFVDARDGGVIGRQRLDAPYYPSSRVVRTTPGYGWTEEEADLRRAGRDSERLVPPGDIPLPRPSLHAEIDRAPAASPRPGVSDGGTFGVNPDARPGPKAEPGRGDKARVAAPRKTAKLTPPVKPAAPSAVPEAPVPPVTSVEPAAPSAPVTPGAAKNPDAAPAGAKASESKASESKAPEAAPATPAAKLPLAPEASPGERAATGKPAGDKVADKAPASGEARNQGWQDPPASDQKRNVRVIGGAIVVPGGGGEAAPAAAN